MKKYVLSTIAILCLLSGVAYAASQGSVQFPYQGGTGSSAPPVYGQMLVGNSNGTYTLTATSSLGIVSASGAAYAFPLTTPTPGNATSTLTQFNGGLTSYAST